MARIPGRLHPGVSVALDDPRRRHEHGPRQTPFVRRFEPGAHNEAETGAVGGGAVLPT